MKILLTGAQGQVGKCLTRLLNQKNFSYKALSREQLNITEQFAVESAVAQYQPDSIINAAAYTAVDQAELEPDLVYRINSDGAAYLAYAAEKHNALLLHLSSDYVFSGLQKEALFRR